MIPITIGMQIRPDISAVFVLVASKHAEFTDTLSLSSVGKYNHVLSAGLIPINRPSETLWSWKNDAVDTVSSSEEDKEEKLMVGMCKLAMGSLALALVGNLSGSAIRSLVFITSSPSGQPLRTSRSCVAMDFATGDWNQEEEEKQSGAVQ